MNVSAGYVRCGVERRVQPRAQLRAVAVDERELQVPAASGGRPLLGAAERIADLRRAGWCSSWRAGGSARPPTRRGRRSRTRPSRSRPARVSSPGTPGCVCASDAPLVGRRRRCWRRGPSTPACPGPGSPAYWSHTPGAVFGGTPCVGGAASATAGTSVATRPATRRDGGDDALRTNHSRPPASRRKRLSVAVEHRFAQYAGRSAARRCTMRCPTRRKEAARSDNLIRCPT